MKSSTWNRVLAGAGLIAQSLGWTFVAFHLSAPFVYLWSGVTAIYGLVLLFQARKRDIQERARDLEITARVAHHGMRLSRQKDEREKNKSVEIVRREKKIGDEKRRGPMKVREKRLRWQLYHCGRCDWEGHRYIRTKKGLKVCPACRQPVKKGKR